MARAKSKVPQTIGPEIVTETPEDIAKQEAAMREQDELNAKETAIIDAEFGDNLPYEIDRIVNESRFFYQQLQVNAIELGKRLLLLKQHEKHGDFHSALEQIGIEIRPAQKLMQLTRTFGKAVMKPLQQLSKTKLLELMVEPDETLEDLANGGELYGHTLDDIDVMTAKELRETLRQERKARKDDAEATERQLQDKDKKINELDRRINNRLTDINPVIQQQIPNILEQSGACILALKSIEKQIEVCNNPKLHMADSVDLVDDDWDRVRTQLCNEMYDQIFKVADLLEHIKDCAGVIEDVYEGCNRL